MRPTLRYYSTHRPTDDHGAQPIVLVVFHDELAATHFLRVAHEQMARSDVEVPLLVSHRGLLEREGPLGGRPRPPARLSGTNSRRRMNIMRLYYIDEPEGPRRYVRTALGVDAERWNDLFGDIYEWRRELQERYAIPPDRELHACDLLAGRGMLARNGGSSERLSPRQGAEVFLDGLRRIEDAAIRIGGIEVINVCIRKSAVKAYEKVSLDRLLNRINNSVKAAGRHAFLIFDEGKEKMITRAYRRLRIFNDRALNREASRRDPQGIVRR